VTGEALMASCTAAAFDVCYKVNAIALLSAPVVVLHAAVFGVARTGVGGMSSHVCECVLH
jgi:hypothetical protein